jgi:hypothetical protein
VTNLKRLAERVCSGLLLLAWMGVIYHLSDVPNSNQMTREIFGSFNYWVRKGSHMSEFAVLFALVFWFQSSFRGNVCVDKVAGEKRPVLRLLLPFIFTFLYALSDEWHQSYVPGRSALLSDVLIDLGGAAMAALLSFFAGRRCSAQATSKHNKSSLP